MAERGTPVFLGPAEGNNMKAFRKRPLRPPSVLLSRGPYNFLCCFTYNVHKDVFNGSSCGCPCLSHSLLEPGSGKLRLRAVLHNVVDALLQYGPIFVVKVCLFSGEFNGCLNFSFCPWKCMTAPMAVSGWAVLVAYCDNVAWVAEDRVVAIWAMGNRLFSTVFAEFPIVLREFLIRAIRDMAIRTDLSYVITHLVPPVSGERGSASWFGHIKQP